MVEVALVSFLAAEGERSEEEIDEIIAGLFSYKGRRERTERKKRHPDGRGAKRSGALLMSLSVIEQYRKIKKIAGGGGI